MSKTPLSFAVLLGIIAFGIGGFQPFGLAKKTKSVQSAKLGSISGGISFRAKPPARKTVDTSADPACGLGQRANAVIVTKGKLKDVHVRIKSGTVGTYKAPAKPVVIVQKGCVYLPHVAGAMVGQPVVIKNSDQTMHNVHAYIGRETWFNRSQPQGAADIVETDTGEAGEVFELKCNVHGWMNSYLPITDHPFFDVSARNGSFEIKNVPVGTYTLEAWHPKFGLKSKEVKVGKGKTRVSFEFP